MFEKKGHRGGKAHEELYKSQEVRNLVGSHHAGTSLLPFPSERFW